MVLKPRQNGPNFAQDTFLCILLNEKCCFWFKLRRMLFLRIQLIINKHWFRWLLVAELETSHNLNQRRSNLLMHICAILSRWINYIGATVLRTRNIRLNTDRHRPNIMVPYILVPYGSRSSPCAMLNWLLSMPIIEHHIQCTPQNVYLGLLCQLIFAIKVPW